MIVIGECSDEHSPIDSVIDYCPVSGPPGFELSLIPALESQEQVNDAPLKQSQITSERHPQSYVVVLP